MPNNKYSITCVHQRVFSQLKKCQALFLKRPAGDALVAMIWNIHGRNVLYYLILKNFSKYKKAVTSNIDFSIVVGSRFTSRMVGRHLSHPSSIYGWVNSNSDEHCVLKLSTQTNKNKRFNKRARADEPVIIMAVLQHFFCLPERTQNVLRTIYT